MCLHKANANSRVMKGHLRKFIEWFNCDVFVKLVKKLAYVHSRRKFKEYLIDVTRLMLSCGLVCTSPKFHDYPHICAMMISVIHWTLIGYKCHAPSIGPVSISRLSGYSTLSLIKKHTTSVCRCTVIRMQVLSAFVRTADRYSVQLALSFKSPYSCRWITWPNCTLCVGTPWNVHVIYPVAPVWNRLRFVKARVVTCSHF